ncbi:hypothetical protein [Kordia sp.]|uniref:hypothetical protein n=1 Tax=Kordia sp. TaxID=1965332 RepID=UPI003B59DF0A
MKERKYYSQGAYFIKAILIVIVIAVTFYIITVLSDSMAEWFSMKLRKNLVFIEYVINAFFGIISILTITYIVLTGKPHITISDTTLRTNRFKKDFVELKSYHPGRGGSEPYLISHDEKQYDLELSWFSKRDRKEIEALIQERVTTI